MTIRIIILLFLMAPFLSFSQGNNENTYQYTVDLSRVVDDRIFVELNAPAIKEKEITFYFPKIVPGTYSIADYGRYVTDLRALDKKGKQLPVSKTNENTWQIKNAHKLEKITYWVDDTWDTSVKGPSIFWPAGTNIEEGKNYVINTSGFFGYFEGMKEPDFQLNIIRPKDLYGSTGLIPQETSAP